MASDRKLAIGAVALTTVKNNRLEGVVMQEVVHEVEEVMEATNYLRGAPFKWITLIFRYGLKNEEKPHYQRINRKYGDLPVAIEVDARELYEANRDELKRLLTIAVLKTLIDVGKKYGLATAKLESWLDVLTYRISGDSGDNDWSHADYSKSA
jgi:hypothetical protein